jgi:CRISPR-associated protein Csm5
MAGGEAVMEGYLKSYDIRLETLGPVHIGSGNKIGKKEYILDKKSNTVYVPDMYKLYEGLRSMKLTKSFEDFIVGGNFRNGLAEWLRQNNVQKKDYESWISYKMSFADVADNDKPVHEINTFVKDPYGMPYVPGSSIKGMIRNILMAKLIKDNPKITEKHAAEVQNVLNNNDSRIKRNTYLNREVRNLETDFFNQLKRPDTQIKDAVNDMMSAIRVSDSKPLSTDDIVLCQKVDLNEKGNEQDLPILRECIKPGVVIEASLTIDTSLSKKLTASVIRSAADSFSQMYNVNFRDAFKEYLEEDSTEEDMKGIVYLGGGVGFVTKTAIYPMYGKKQGVRNTARIFEKTIGRQYREHKHDTDVRRGVSPHICKITYCDGYVYEMGRCRLTLTGAEC